MESCQILAVAGILVEPCYWRFKIAWTPFGVVLFGEEDFHPLVDHCPLLLLGTKINPISLLEMLTLNDVAIDFEFTFDAKDLNPIAVSFDTAFRRFSVFGRLRQFARRGFYGN